MSLQWGKAASIGRKMLYAVLCAFMFTTAALPSIAAEPSAGEGRLIHVAKNGSDSNSGTEAEPYLTINHAAQEAQPGDTVVVHAGLYRETVKPARGGTDESHRITYTNAGDGEVAIKGSEEINSWTPYSGDVWRVTLPDSYFGNYNPYAARQPQGGEGGFFAGYTAGDVYLDEQAYYEKGALSSVLSSGDTWYTEVSGGSTIIYANFDGADPNEKLAEINVRKQIFAPDAWGLGYITVDGFTVKHAANTYSDFPSVPSRGQAGAISVNGGLKWIIQNNIVINARTIGIDIGLGNDEWAGNRQGNTRTDYHDTDKYGSHIVRNNYIAKSGQSGIAGVFSWNSDIMYNMIEDTNYRGEFSGAETAPIKVHYMNEGLIKGNYIKNSKGGNSAGIWTDWGNQNVRITGNIVMNSPWGYYAEAVQGPILVDNNVFIGNSDIRMLDATGVVFANNLFIDNGNINVDGGGRDNYYFEPGTMNETSSVNSTQKFFWYNNLVQGSVLPSNAANKTHVKEGNFTNVISSVAYTATNEDMSLSFDLDVSGISGLSPVTQERVGLIPKANESIAADVDTDFYGSAVQSGSVMAGPFADAHNGANTYVLWPPQGQTVPKPPAPPANVPVNLALNPDAAVTASYEDGTLTAAKAIDGNGSTRWSTDHSNDNNAWIAVDLGDIYNVSKVVLSWEAASAREYKVQISDDGEHWSDAYYTATGAGGNETVAIRKNTRYVRMQGIAPKTAYGYSLYEFEIYGTPVEPDVPVNVALNKAPSAYTASSQSNDGSGEVNSQPDKDRSAFRAFDGNAGTRWGSNGGDDNWLQVDLGQTDIIDKIVLMWEGAYASQYKIQVSDDGSSWTDVHTHNDASPIGDHTDEIALDQPAEGRYVRMQGVKAATQWGLSLYEFEVYGKVKPADTAPEWPPTASLAAMEITDAAANVQWPAAVDNQAVTGYKVYLGQTLVTSLDANTRDYKITGLAAGKTYTVKVVAIDESGNESGALAKTFTTSGNSATKALSTTYPRNYGDWEDGLLAGNGKQGIIVFGSPREDTVVFDDRDFFMARTENRPSRTFNTVSEENIQQIRDLLVAGSYQQANQLAADVQGYQGGGEGSKHPGYKMTITMPDSGEISNYVRSTDYSTGVVGVNWSDDKGDWERDSFVSRTDGVTVQYLPAPTGQKLDVKLALSIDPGMNLLNKGVTVDDNSSVDFLNLRAKYPNGSYNAGYEGVTRIVTDGTKVMDGDAVSVSGATYVLLLSLTERYDGTYEGGVPAEQEWNRELLQDRLSGIAGDYQTLLNRHVSEHSKIFDRVSIDFGASAEDRSKSSEELLAMQKASATPVPALYERMFYSGRYHLLGSSNDTAAPDLLGNWTGDSNVGWDGYYHLDANLNLQISGGNIGNMPEAMAGYFYLNKQWQDDFRTNARKLLGTRGMLTGGNTPNGEGLISNINFDYPYQYVTGGESWLLYPFWEHYEVTGDKDFLANQYYPLIRDMGDFYEDFLVEKDSSGKYIFAGSISPENRPAGGVPLSVNSVYDISGARFALETLIETSAILGKDQDKIPVWQELLDNLPPYLVNNDGALAEWAWPDLMNKNNYQHRHSSGMMPVWPYREITPEKNQELYDAARISLQKKDGGNYENAGHGLLHSALIAADLNNADSVNAKLMRFAKDDYYYTSLATSHYNNHGTFATDVVNSVPTIMMEMLATSDAGTLELLPALPKSLKTGSISGMLGKSRFTIDNLSWDMDHRTVEARLTSGIDQDLTLIQRAGIEEISSDDVEIQSSPLGNIARILPLKANETVTVKLTLKDAAKVNLALGKTASASSQSNDQQTADQAFDGNSATRWGADESADNWLQVDLGDIYALTEVDLQWEASFAKAYKLQASMDGVNWKDVYTQTGSQGGMEKIPVDALGRYVRMQGMEKSGQWGYSLYEMEVYGQEAPNIALGKPAEASSESNAQQTAAAAFDGEMTTRWGASEPADNWLQVDLEAIYNVNRVVIEWEDSYAKGYKLQISPDGRIWTDVFTEANSNGGTDMIDLDASTRYIRMQGTEKSGQWGYSIYEMKVNGTLIDNQAAVNQVMEELNALPAAAEVSLGDRQEIESARAAYNALSDEQKVLVAEESLAKLLAAEQRLGELTEAGGTAASVADAVTAVAAPVKDATMLTLPAVPEGFSIAIKSSDKPDVIGVNGQITPQAADTEVTLVLTVTRTSDGSMADTAELKVTVPAKSTIEPTASEVAAGITALTPPLKDVTLLTLPAVPAGFSVAIKDSDKPDVIGLSGQVTPQAVDTEVTLVLTVTRTSDGSPADTTGLKVTVPAKSVEEPTAAGVAETITTLAAPVKDAAQLLFPVVPEGFSLSIKSSDKLDVIGLSGQITPQAADTEVTLVLTVTRLSDGSMADTAGLKVTVPAKSVVEPTAASIAGTLTALAAPAKDATTLTLPTVPEGFSVAIKDSDKPDVIGLSGQITPQAADTEVMLVLTVTRTSDGSTADMSGLKVTVPAMTAAEPTAANIAGAITILAAPEVDATLLTLPVVPEGYSLSIKSVDNPGVIGLGGQIAPPSADTEVTLVLTVTKTSDGSTADTAGLKVIVPAKTQPVPDNNGGSSGGNNGGNNGNNSGTTLDSDGGGTGQEPSMTHTVTTGDLADLAADGTLIVPVSGDIRQVVLPPQAAELPADGRIVVRSEAYALELPAGTLRQLMERAEAMNLADGKLSVDIDLLPEANAQPLLGSLPGKTKATLASAVYDFSLSYAANDGKTAAIAQLAEPIVIRLKADPGINPKLAGIYRLRDNGEPEYIGGAYENGEWVSQVSEFGKYAVIETVWQFRDVPSGYWAENVIQELAAKQIVNGTDEASFEPGRAVSRAEFTALLVRALKLTETGDAAFADVKPEDWYAEAVLIAAKAGIATGKGEGVFDPNAQITREEMVTMLMRAYIAANGVGNDGASGAVFGDEGEISSWASEYVRNAAALQLIQDRSAGLFDPQGIATRAESAQIIYNLLNS